MVFWWSLAKRDCAKPKAAESNKREQELESSDPQPVVHDDIDPMVMPVPVQDLPNIIAWVK